MPNYEFQCEDGHITEQRLPITSEVQEIVCACCERAAKRIISRSTFHFKCGGFFYTDYVRQNTTAGSED